MQKLAKFFINFYAPQVFPAAFLFGKKNY